MRKTLLTATALIALAPPATAHFGMILPSTPMLEQEDGREVTLEVGFGHPFEPSGMELARPAVFGVHSAEGDTDLLDALEDADFHGAAGFTLTHPVTKPGVQVFYMEPQPYWEPAEDVFIVHYSKTYLPAFGDDTGWDAELGLETEIVPLTRPFGLWAGNAFQGIVKRDGAAVPNAEIEVEHYNEGGVATAPSELMVTQTVRADADGVFTYAAPAPGWWGFAALSTADEQMDHEGETKDVEIGAVIWVHFEPWETTQ